MRRSALFLASALLFFWRYQWAPRRASSAPSQQKPLIGFALRASGRRDAATVDILGGFWPPARPSGLIRLQEAHRLGRIQRRVACHKSKGASSFLSGHGVVRTQAGLAPGIRSSPSDVGADNHLAARSPRPCAGRSRRLEADRRW